jgi:hypothetical protein
MSDDRRIKVVQSGAAGGLIWFFGWLFTIGFLNLSFWKIVLGIFVWPYYLGQALR